MRRVCFTFVIFASILVYISSLALAGTTERVSVSSNGEQGNADVDYYLSISADGRYVAFPSLASNLVEGDTNGHVDVFVKDRVTGATELISVASSGANANNSSTFPRISADGRYVAFISSASNLVPVDTNGCPDVFVRDRTTGVTECVSVSSSGTLSNNTSETPSISADGRYVVFASRGSNLISGDTNGAQDIFLRDRVTGTTERISISSNGAQVNGDSFKPFISTDGRYVAFDSIAMNLVTGDTNWWSDVFVRDRVTGLTERISISSSGVQGNGDSWGPSITTDGRYVAFDCYAKNLVPGDTNKSIDVLVRDRVTGITERISASSSGTQANRDSHDSCISPDGRYVAFCSSATNLISGDTNGWGDIFIKDRVSGSIERLSVSSTGSQANSGSWYLSISENCRFVAFWSFASNLVPDDASGPATDIFVRDRWNLSSAKTIHDTDPVVASAYTVTAKFPDCFYIESADRTTGIKVISSAPATEGSRVRVDGTMTTVGSERCIQATNVRRVDDLPVSPLGFLNKFLGGIKFGSDPNTQVGVSDGFGLNNIGLLVRTWGKVTQIGTDYLYIDDGSGLKDGTLTGTEKNVGVRVICDPAGHKNGDFLTVTGISSCFETASGRIAARVLTRRGSDVR